MIITKDFKDLVEYSQCHGKLLELLNYVNDFVEYHFKKDICVTEIGRTVEEQKKLYPNEPHKMTLHMTNPIQAIDLRSWTFKDTERVLLIRAINDNWDFGYEGMQKINCCIYHKITGNVDHFHIQVCDKTKLKNI